MILAGKYKDGGGLFHDLWLTSAAVLAWQLAGRPTTNTKDIVGYIPRANRDPLPEQHEPRFDDIVALASCEADALVAAGVGVYA